MSELVEVRVSEKEWRLLQREHLLPLDLQRIVSEAMPLPNGRYVVRIPYERIEEVRDALTEGLAITGFKGAAYELTEDGRMLEDLIDKLFIP